MTVHDLPVFQSIMLGIGSVCGHNSDLDQQKDPKPERGEPKPDKIKNAFYEIPFLSSISLMEHVQDGEN